MCTEGAGITWAETVHSQVAVIGRQAKTLAVALGAAAAVVVALAAIVAVLVVEAVAVPPAALLYVASNKNG